MPFVGPAIDRALTVLDAGESLTVVDGDGGDGDDGGVASVPVRIAAEG